jgi:hypothetical protein
MLNGVSSFDRDDEIYVLVTPNDGSDDGVLVESDHAVVLNIVPTEPSISLTSLVIPPMAGIDDLTCQVTGVSTDLDGDVVAYIYEWFDNVGALQQTTSNSVSISDTLSGIGVTLGMWTCQVRAFDGTDYSTPTSTQIMVESDWSGVVTFSNCGQTGRTGPSQSQCDLEYLGTELEGIVPLSSGYQTWTVPFDGIFLIEVAGAQGGDLNSSHSGGEGSVMIGEFELTTGTIVEILVGQQGQNSINASSGYSAGGGGGTFVAINGVALIVAGGGGGAGVTDTCSGFPHLISGLAGQQTVLGVPGQSSSCVNNAIVPGEGGGGDTCNSGASPGAGFFGNSQAYSSVSWGAEAYSFVNGGNGALQRTQGGNGGFGGGGAGAFGGGGGGGYSGGGTGDYDIPCRDQGGGGAGSYNSGSNQSNSTGGNTGFGYVIIDR